MRQKFQKLYFALSGVLVLSSVVGAVYFQPKPAYAAAGSIYVSPNSVNLVNGSTTTVSITADSGGATVNTGQATLLYDKTKVQVMSIDMTGAPLTEGANYSDDHNGIVSGGAYSSSQSLPSGTVKLVNITFKALVGSGSTTLQLTNSHSYPYYTDVQKGDGSGSIGSTLVNGTITFSQPSCPAGYTGTYPNCTAPTCPTGQTGTPPNCTTPTQTCPAGQTGTPPNCTTPKGGGTGGNGGTGGSTSTGSGSSGSTSSGGNTSNGSSSTPTQVASGLTVDSVDVQYTDASFKITTKDQTQVYVQYGMSKDKLSEQTVPTAFATVHTLTLSASALNPGQTYYYVIVSTDPNGKVVKSDVLKLNTRGITVKVGVFDKNNNPLAGKEITIHSTPQTAKTDSHGMVTFADVAPGDHKLQYTVGKQQLVKDIVVTNSITTASDGSQTAKDQNFSVVYPLAQTSHTGLIITLIAIVILVILIGGGYWLYPERFRNLVKRLFRRTPKARATAQTTEPLMTVTPAVSSPTPVGQTTETPETPQTPSAPADTPAPPMVPGSTVIAPQPPSDSTEERKA